MIEDTRAGRFTQVFLLVQGVSPLKMAAGENTKGMNAVISAPAHDDFTGVKAQLAPEEDAIIPPGRVTGQTHPRFI